MTLNEETLVHEAWYVVFRTGTTVTLVFLQNHHL